MKFIPILYSGPMVRANLNGTKTQTRRLVTPQPDDDGLWNDDDYPRSIDSALKGWNGTVSLTGESKEFKCRYGKPGDIHWVRENFRKYYPSLDGYLDFDNPIIEYQADGLEEVYLMDGDGFHQYKKNGEMKTIACKPNIHMPKELCRIFNMVTKVRLEKLHDISSEDAIAEGIEFQEFPELKIKAYKLYGSNDWDENPINSYFSLWIQLHGEKSFRENPWVWVIDFEKIDKPETFLN